MEAQAKKMQAAKMAATQETHADADEEEEAQPAVVEVVSSSEEEGKQHSTFYYLTKLTLQLIYSGAEARETDHRRALG